MCLKGFFVMKINDFEVSLVRERAIFCWLYCTEIISRSTTLTMSDGLIRHLGSPKDSTTHHKGRGKHQEA